VSRNSSMPPPSTRGNAWKGLAADRRNVGSEGSPQDPRGRPVSSTTAASPRWADSGKEPRRTRATTGGAVTGALVSEPPLERLQIEEGTTLASGAIRNAASSSVNPVARRSAESLREHRSGGSGSGNEEAGCRPENWSSVTNSDPKRPVEFGRFRGCRSSGREVGGKSSRRVGGEEIRGHYDQGQILRPRSNCLSCFRVRDFGHFGAWKDAPWGGQIERKLSGTAEFEHCYSRKGGGDYRQTSPSSFVCSRVANL